MRHNIDGRKFNMDGSQRKAMYRNMADSLIRYGRILTTSERAKEVRKLAERLISLAKKGDLHAKRKALSILRTKDAFVKLFGEYAERFKSRNGGYTRIIKAGLRHGDSAQLAYIEYLADGTEKKAAKKRRRRRSKKSGAGQEAAQDSAE
ncbi:MAG: 50S ribosomal protein L17 [Oligoflexia bacterium]|nr:50S ribosomal protein L17 [Oligoflexia bacterium]